jgi:anti-sigma-K factor RskA
VTIEDSTSGERDCGADAAAYVLGALEPDEAEAFRRHMAGCVVCRDEVAAFQQVADSLAMAPVQHAAPKGLRRRVLRAVRTEREQGQRQRQGQGQGQRQRQGQGQAQAQEHAHDPAWRPAPVRAGRLRSGPAIAAAAALAAVVALVVGVELGSRGSSSARVIAASVSGSPGSAQLRVTGQRAELIVRRFPQPAPGHIYEVWELRSGARAPSPTRTLFSVNSSGAGDVGVPGDLKGVSQVLVTQEPAGGSRVPTRAPVIVASLA